MNNKIVGHNIKYKRVTFSHPNKQIYFWIKFMNNKIFDDPGKHVPIL